jgi:hypothetical protein
MAVKITHRFNDQQIRFANHEGATRYAEIVGGGVDKWEFTVVPSNVPSRDPVGPRATSVTGSAPAPQSEDRPSGHPAAGTKTR